MGGILVLGSGVAADLHAIKKPVITHEEWRRTPIGQRVLFECWLRAVGAAAYHGQVKLHGHVNVWALLMPHTVLG